MMFEFLFSCFWYLLPAALANHNASCGEHLPLPGPLKRFLAKTAVPVDLGRTWNGGHIFGKNKTWRGILVGMLTGIIVAGLQALLYFNFRFFAATTLVDYTNVNFILFGFLMGTGALSGDLIESFIKRRLGKPSGRPWFPWDQADWILGAVAMSSFMYIPSSKVFLATLIMYVLVHLCSDRVVCWLGIKSEEEIN
ncbi:MAG: CDP-archaeol synthase [Candidatus Omnitrophica bacterium]|nr:CDP-archaeol synthase [Candidatus Omnitrophota bacterium]